MKPSEIYNLAAERGIYLSYWSESSVAAAPAGLLDKELEKILVEHQAALIPWLKKKVTSWLHLCKQVALGEFDHADEKTRERIAGAVSGNHPICQAARRRLQKINTHQ